MGGKTGGMTSCNGKDIVAALQEAGLPDTRVDENDKGWIFVTARK